MNTAAWTTEVGCSSFLGRTQLADWVSPAGVGTFVVGSKGAELALNTFNPTGFSLYGTHGKTLQYFQPTATSAVVFTTRMQLTSIQPGLVYGIYLYGIATPCSSQTQHDEIDIELVTNFLQPGKPLMVQLNRYAQDPLGTGNPVQVNLPAGFDPLAVHDWTIQWSLTNITYLVDGTPLYSTNAHVPQGSMQADVIAWAPDTTWPDAYSASLQPVTSAGLNQRFVAYLRSVTVSAIATSPQLAIIKSHNGIFTRGQAQAIYTLTVYNANYTTGTSGTVTVTENVPTGLQLVSMSGTGWTCPPGNTCTRSDSLASGSNYPPITVTVAVASNAPSTVTNQATVSGGGSVTASASDPTSVVQQGPTQLKITTMPVNGTVGTPIPPMVVQIQDFMGNLVTSSNALVNVVSNPAGVNATVAAVNGVATFNNLLFRSPGTYTLTAFSNGLTPAPSIPFSITKAGLEFYPLTPCRLLDTRVATSPARPQPIMGGTTFMLAVPPNTCGIPANAVAYDLNVTAVTQGYLGYLSIWPAGQPMPNVSTLNSYLNSGTAIANAAIVPAGVGSGINIFVTDTTDVVVDIYGYFAVPAPNGSEFYPLAPCRLMDTRVSSFPGTFGPPTLISGETRTLPVPNNCGIPANATAYSLNVTAVTQGYLGYLSIWPAGQKMPNASTLNSYSRAPVAVANAAIVPAGANGAINIFVTDPTDLVIDVDGYFAPPSSSGLLFYPVTPCRVADTRLASFPPDLGPPSMDGVNPRSFPVPQSNCGLPATAGAYSFNFTAVPQAPQLGIFTVWPTGLPMPNVSTMNSYNGLVVSNAAIVPAGTGGAISIFVTDPADVLFDINGYFSQ